MGLTIHYRFSPGAPTDMPLENPQAAAERIAAACDLAARGLEQQGIPCARTALRIERRENAEFYEASLLLEGPAEGCELLTFGWSRFPPDPWSNKNFCKTQYAADFLTAHPAICHVLSLLEQNGFIAEVKDEAEYYGSDKTIAELAVTYGEWNAMLGSLHDQLQGMGIAYRATTTGGGTYEYPGPRE